jgi:hypothetical protein
LTIGKRIGLVLRRGSRPFEDQIRDAIVLRRTKILALRCLIQGRLLLRRPEMIASLKRMAAVLPAALTLSAAALATPASSAWRDHHGAYRHADHWRAGWGCEGAGCYRYGYGPFYRGYGHNSNNWCYSGESMYDGC